MKIDILDFEYLPNIFYSDVSVFKHSSSYEISYTVFFETSLSADYKNKDITLKHKISYNQEESELLLSGQSTINNISHDLIHISQFKEVINGEHKRYYLQREILLSDNDFDSLHLFSCLSLKMKTGNYNGPIKAEKIFGVNKEINRSNFSLYRQDGVEYGGPIHSHNNVIMEGSFHTSTAHETLNMKMHNSQKIVYLPDENFSKTQRHLDKEKVFYSFPYVEDFHNNNSFVFTVNSTRIILDNSKSAKILFDQNPELFLELSKFIKIKKIKVFREEKKQEVFINRLGMPVDREVLKTSELIAEADLSQNILPKTDRYFLENKEYVNVVKERLPETSENFIPSQQDVSKQHVESGLLISSMETIDATEDNLNYFKFTDFEIKNLAGKDFFYKLEVEFENFVLLYIEQTIMNFRKQCQALLSEISKVQFNEQGKVSKAYIQKFLDNNRILYNEELIPIHNQQEKMNNLFFYTNSNAYKNTFDLVSAGGYNFQSIFNCLNIFETNRIRLEKVKAKFTNLLSFVETLYRPKKVEENFKNSTVVTSITNDYLIKVTHTVKEKYKKSMNSLISYCFMEAEQFSEILKLNNNQILLRGNIEQQKYLRSAFQRGDRVLSSLTPRQREKFLNLRKSQYKYFTPLSIKIGNKNSLMDNFNVRTTNRGFLNVLNFTRMATEFLNIVNSEEKLLTSVFPSVSVYERPVDSENVSVRESSFIDAGEAFANPLLGVFTDPDLQVGDNLENLFKNKELAAQIQSSIYNKKNKGSFKIDTLDLTSRSNKIVGSKIDLTDVPVQIKSLMASKSPSVKNNFSQNNFTDLEDPKDRESLFQFFSNIKIIKVFIGFEMIGGIHNFSRPIYQDLNYDVLVSLEDRNFLCELDQYNINYVHNFENDFKALDTFFQVINRAPVLPQVGTFNRQSFNFNLTFENTYSRSISVKQSAENFGEALILPTRKMKASIQNTQTPSAPSAVNTNQSMGGSNVSY